jgi:AcrR family transcriptional regulator
LLTYNLYAKITATKDGGSLAMGTTGTAGGEGAVALATRAVEPRGRVAQMEATRRALLDAARTLFTAEGYQATRTEEVVRMAGVTRGALYHHFKDKEDLFLAVLAEVEAEVAGTLLRHSDAPELSSWELFRINNQRQLAAAVSNASFRQIALIDGPAVLGARVWAERQSASMVRIEAYLHRAMEEGSIERVEVEPLARLLIALGSAAALSLAQAEDTDKADAAISEITDKMLDGLQVRRAE